MRMNATFFHFGNFLGGDFFEKIPRGGCDSWSINWHANAQEAGHVAVTRGHLLLLPRTAPHPPNPSPSFSEPPLIGLSRNRCTIKISRKGPKFRRCVSDNSRDRCVSKRKSPAARAVRHQFRKKIINTKRSQFAS